MVPPRNPCAQKMWNVRPLGAIATTGSRLFGAILNLIARGRPAIGQPESAGANEIRIVGVGVGTGASEAHAAKHVERTVAPTNRIETFNATLGARCDPCLSALSSNEARRTSGRLPSASTGQAGIGAQKPPS